MISFCLAIRNHICPLRFKCTVPTEVAEESKSSIRFKSSQIRKGQCTLVPWRSALLLNAAVSYVSASSIKICSLLTCRSRLSVTKFHNALLAFYPPKSPIRSRAPERSIKVRSAKASLFSSNQAPSHSSNKVTLFARRDRNI